ncbi:hypothetical protein EDC94DRAFT_583898 [Helicostylum pulchrum]|nr:hypothetical protein EDC94DRAFT_583898 [Helicostylum pulchrum]
MVDIVKFVDFFMMIIIGDNARINKESSDSNVREREERDADDNNNNKEASIWSDWLRFLEHHKSAFHPYSPKANNVIRAGNGVSSKPYLGNTLYTKHLEGRTVHGLDIPAMLKEHIDAVLECNSLGQLKKNIKKYSKLDL